MVTLKTGEAFRFTRMRHMLLTTVTGQATMAGLSKGMGSFQ